MTLSQRANVNYGPTKGLIIGFGHVARVGKDTAATALVRDLGFVRTGFADELKELALAIDPKVIDGGTRNVGIGRDRLRWLIGGTSWEQAKDQFPEVRRFLENLGAACRDTFGETCWIDLAMKGGEVQNLVIPDVRHLNEAEAIQAAGGKVIRIDRKGVKADPIRRPSEAHLLDWDGWDAVLENNGDVRQLEGAAVELVKRFLDAPVELPSSR